MWRNLLPADETVNLSGEPRLQQDVPVTWCYSRTVKSPSEDILPESQTKPLAGRHQLRSLGKTILFVSDHYKLVFKSIETLQHSTWPDNQHQPLGFQSDVIRRPVEQTSQLPGPLSRESGLERKAGGKWFYNCDEQKLSKSGKIRGTSKLLLLQTHHLCCSIYQSSNKVTTEIFSYNKVLLPTYSQSKQKPKIMSFWIYFGNYMPN